MTVMPRGCVVEVWVTSPPGVSQALLPGGLARRLAWLMNLLGRLCGRRAGW